MRAGVASLALFACVATTAATSSSADPLRSALPPNAHVVTNTSIPGHTADIAVLYRTDRLYLGVVELGRNSRLVWSRGLSGTSAAFSNPGQTGLVRVLVQSTPRPVRRLYAYILRAGTVQSAIERHASGSLSGDEGITLHSKSFVVRSRDLKHLGSVSYRLTAKYAWNGSQYRRVSAVRVPDYSLNQYPSPSGVVRLSNGNVVLMRLEVAATEHDREVGLMRRTSLDADTGMLFAWDQLSHESFWMANTYIPLSVAFMDDRGVIQEVQDMEPLTTTLHTPVQSYRYALEVNKGFFSKQGIRAGARVQLHLAN